MIDINDIMVPPGYAPGPGQIAQSGAGFKPAVKNSKDLQRILRLPSRTVPGDERIDALRAFVTAKLRRDNPACCCHTIRKGGCIKELNASQAWALYELAVYGGVLGGIGVGHGKTLLGILSAMVAKGCRTALILVPPKLIDQLILEYKMASQHFRVPNIKIHTSGKKVISQLAAAGAPWLHVMPYSRLSRETAAQFIKDLEPDLIISDECHSLKDIKGSTRAARVQRYLTEESPETRFAGWTGSLTDKSLTDYGHISSWALKQGSPLPLDEMTLNAWATAIDPSEWPAEPGALHALCEPGEHIHSGYHRRLSTTPGVILTKKAAIDAAYIITERKPPPVPDVVRAALHSIRGFVRPDGEELVEAWEVARSARQAACGFYYRWKFVAGETDEQIAAWLSARKEWNQELREKIAPRSEYLDSPLLCQRAADRHADGIDPTICLGCDGTGRTAVEHCTNPDHDADCSGRHTECDLCPECRGRGKVCAKPVWESEFWAPWKAVRDSVKPITEAVRLSPYLAEDAAEWGLRERGVIWYSYNALGDWISEISGLPLHGGGPHCDKRIASEDGSTSIVASIQAHGTGRDGLQRLFSKQLICNPPSSATAWEQLLGRLHRLGQNAPQVFGELYLHTEEFRSSLDKAMTRSLYVQQTLGSAQKLQTAMG